MIVVEWVTVALALVAVFAAINLMQQPHYTTAPASRRYALALLGIGLAWASLDTGCAVGVDGAKLTMMAGIIILFVRSVALDIISRRQGRGPLEL